MALKIDLFSIISLIAVGSLWALLNFIIHGGETIILIGLIVGSIIFSTALYIILSTQKVKEFAKISIAGFLAPIVYNFTLPITSPLISSAAPPIEVIIGLYPTALFDSVFIALGAVGLYVILKKTLRR